MLAIDVMTRNPVSVRPTTKIADAIEVMAANDVRHVPVLDGRELVGILSDRDLRGLWDPSSEAVRDGRVYYRPVADFMSRDPVTVEIETDIDEVIETLIEHRVGAVPVVDAEGGLVGIVSYIDVLRAALGKL